MRQQLTSAVRTSLLGLAVLTVAGCSDGAEVAPTVTSASASVTQPAPSVWSPPETTPNTATESSSAAADDPLATPTPLPGLSAECTVSIHAQAGVNELFATALETAESVSPTEGSVPPTDDAAATAGTASATSTTDEVTGPPALTAEQVAALFDKITPQVPAAVAPSFERLHTAAARMTTEPARMVPDILAEPEVVAATKAIGDFIAACTPESTS